MEDLTDFGLFIVSFFMRVLYWVFIWIFAGWIYKGIKKLFSRGKKTQVKAEEDFGQGGYVIYDEFQQYPNDEE